MAYSPIDQAALPRRRAAPSTAPPRRERGAGGARLGAAPARRDRHPEGGAARRILRENLAASSIELDAEALHAIDAAFAPPREATPLAIN